MPPTAQQDRQQDRQDRITDVRNVATYPTPILAQYRGRVVRLIATGDAEGHSPVVQAVDDQGELQWLEQADVRVVDMNFLPPSQETLRTINSTFTLGQAGR